MAESLLFAFREDFRERTVELTPAELTEARLVFDGLLRGIKTHPQAVDRGFPTVSDEELFVLVGDGDGERLQADLVETGESDIDGVVASVTAQAVNTEDETIGTISRYGRHEDGVVRRFDMAPDDDDRTVYIDPTGLDETDRYQLGLLQTDDAVPLWVINLAAEVTGARGSQAYAQEVYDEAMGHNNQPVRARELRALAAALGIEVDG